MLFSGPFRFRPLRFSKPRACGSDRPAGKNRKVEGVWKCFHASSAFFARMRLRTCMNCQAGGLRDRHKSFTETTSAGSAAERGLQASVPYSTGISPALKGPGSDQPTEQNFLKRGRNCETIYTPPSHDGIGIYRLESYPGPPSHRPAALPAGRGRRAGQVFRLPYLTCHINDSHCATAGPPVVCAGRQEAKGKRAAGNRRDGSRSEHEGTLQASEEEERRKFWLFRARSHSDYKHEEN